MRLTLQAQNHYACKEETDYKDWSAAKHAIENKT